MNETPQQPDTPPSPPHIITDLFRAGIETARMTTLLLTLLIRHLPDPADGIPASDPDAP